MRNPETPEDVELIIDAIKQVESSGGKFTTGPKTKYGVAKGSYQVLDTTGQEYHRKLGIDEPYDPYNEEQQREIVRAILGDYMRMFDGDIELALTAYHTGPGNVRKGKIGPQGRAYVPKIEKAMDKLVRQV